jgi:hypothetical protein
VNRTCFLATDFGNYCRAKAQFETIGQTTHIGCVLRNRFDASRRASHECTNHRFQVCRHAGHRGIVAPDLAGAKALITHWLSTRAGKFCRLDVVEGLGLSKWLEAEGLPCVGRVTTMVRGKAPQSGEGPKVFAVAAQALG